MTNAYQGQTIRMPDDHHVIGAAHKIKLLPHPVPEVANLRKSSHGRMRTGGGERVMKGIRGNSTTLARGDMDGWACAW